MALMVGVYLVIGGLPIRTTGRLYHCVLGQDTLPTLPTGGGGLLQPQICRCAKGQLWLLDT